MGNHLIFTSSKRQSVGRLLVSILLVVSGAFTLLSRPTLIEMARKEEIDSWLIFLGPGFFAFFLLLFTLMLFINRGRKIRTLSLVAIFFGSLLLAIIVPDSLREYRARNASTLHNFACLKDFLKSQDARIRALLVMSASCTTSNDKEWSHVVEKGLEDKDPLVREAAKYAIQHKSEHSMALKYQHDGIKSTLENLESK